MIIGASSLKMAHIVPRKDPELMKLMAKKPLTDYDSDYTPSTDENSPSESSLSSRKRKKSMKPIANEATYEQNMKPNKLVWSKDDEVTFLESLIQCVSKGNGDVQVDYNLLLNFIKGKLSVEVTKTKAKDKVKRLKKKYRSNVAKRRSLKSHDARIFSLSEKIWGNNDDENEIANVDCIPDGEPKIGKRKFEKVVTNLDGGLGLHTSLGFQGRTIADLERWFKKNPELIGEEKRNEMLKKSKSMKIAMVEQYVKNIELLTEQGQLMFDAVKPFIK